MIETMKAKLAVFFNRLALAWLARQMRRDPSYAWSWQCNLAMAFYDRANTAGTHESANRAAADFMQSLFGVDVTNAQEWKWLEETWKDHL